MGSDHVFHLYIYNYFKKLKLFYFSCKLAHTDFRDNALDFYKLNFTPFYGIQTEHMIRLTIENKCCVCKKMAKFLSPCFTWHRDIQAVLDLPVLLLIALYTYAERMYLYHSVESVESLKNKLQTSSNLKGLILNSLEPGFVQQSLTLNLKMPGFKHFRPEMKQTYAQIWRILSQGQNIFHHWNFISSL